MTREYYDNPCCAHVGCTERAHYVYATQREFRDGLRRRREHPWRCARHRQPDRVLSPDAPVKTLVLTNTLKHRVTRGGATVPLGLFWVEEGTTSGSGFTYGPGFKAFADDFPEGTRLVVTARIEPFPGTGPAGTSRQEADR